MIGGSGLGPGCCSACCLPPATKQQPHVTAAPADRAAGVSPDAFGSLRSSGTPGDLTCLGTSERP
eukprot:747389-Hanusia_phi.AAC.1